MTSPECETCNGRGWVKDGTSHGTICVDCADPIALKYADPDTPVVNRMGMRRTVVGEREQPASSGFSWSRVRSPDPSWAEKNELDKLNGERNQIVSKSAAFKTPVPKKRKPK